MKKVLTLKEALTPENIKRALRESSKDMEERLEKWLK